MGNSSNDVFLVPEENHLKTNILAPFFSRYRNKKSLRSLDPKMQDLAKHAVLFPAGNTLYVKNSKAGCTSVSHNMYYWDHGAFYDGNIHRCRDLAQGPAWFSKIAQALQNPDVFKFTFVRSPIRRCISGYSNFFLDKTNRSHTFHLPYLQKMGFEGLQSEVDKFDCFLDYVAQTLRLNVDRMDPHFRPQVHNLRPHLVPYNFIGQVENLSNDLEHVANLIGQNHTYQSRKAQQNKSSQSYSPQPYQYQRIKDLYQDDYVWFDQLGFSYDADTGA